jgi:signal transduction histidine kinase
VRQGHEQLQALNHKIVQIQEQERHWVAKDLYDEVGQAVVSSLFQLRLLDQKADQPEMLRASIAELDRGLTAILAELHQLAFSLRPASLDHLGLKEAIRQDLDLIAEKSGLETRLETYGLTRRLPGDVETALYRVVQEALDNAVRHACASRVEITIVEHDGRIVLTIADDGTGFHLETASQGFCFGLLSMRERVEMIGGRLSIETAPGQGTAVSIVLPKAEGDSY